MIRIAASITIAVALPRMARALRHRGPDDEGIHQTPIVGLAARRLAILDLSPAGHQPMSTPDGSVTIAFNGEIYNYIELRTELRARGHAFRSSGDTEVLLAAYLEWGPDCVSRLNGMWAFLIHDQRRRVVFGSRDRLGMKPLYRHVGADAILFASEIKAILASGLYQSRLDWSSARRYLLHARLDDTDETFYEGIEQVGAGRAFEVAQGGALREWSYWSLGDLSAGEVSRPVDRFRDLFDDATRLHSRSDVPVAVSLSGGLDSTAIICALARQRERESAVTSLQAFCYKAEGFDESALIDQTLRWSGAREIDLTTSPQQLWQDFEGMLWAQDEPVHSMTALVGFQLMRLVASENIRVVFSGQGADEVLGGYPSYFREYWQTLIERGQALRAWRELTDFASAHGERRAHLAARQVRHGILGYASRFDAYRGLRDILRRRRHGWFSSDFVESDSDGPGAGAGSGIEAVLRHSVTRSPLPLYLRVEDRNSMAHSVEARLPFLDHRMVELAFSLDPEWRFRGALGKVVFREAMAGQIPEAVRVRIDKMGFPTPWRRWASAELYEPMYDLMNSQPARERGIYNLPAVLRDFELCRRGRIDRSQRMFDVAQFELWMRAQEARPSIVS